MDPETVVLHVDDQPDFGDVSAEFLERERETFDILTATSATEGLEILQETPVDCLVSDYDMPGQNGIELLETVREEYPDLPFILFTGKGSEEVASDAISAGVTDYLQKGSDSSQYTVLANRIDNAVEQYRSNRAIAETERKLTEIANKADELLFMFDGEWGELLFINDAYEEIWGRSIAELEANPESFLATIHPEDRQTAEECMQDVSEGTATVIEYRVRRDDGDLRWVRSEAKPIFDDDGAVVRIVGYVSDITDRKKLEATVEQLDARLQEVERTVSWELEPSLETRTTDFHRVGCTDESDPLASVAASLEGIETRLDELETVARRDAAADSSSS